MCVFVLTEFACFQFFFVLFFNYCIFGMSCVVTSPSVCDLCGRFSFDSPHDVFATVTCVSISLSFLVFSFVVFFHGTPT